MIEVKQPLITIITVVYNAEATLEDTIKSVISVNYRNIDYIIIDGGSKDGTVDVIKKYTSCIKYWVSEPDKGIYDAMNKGWKMAEKNSYILFLGAGDKLLSLPSNISENYYEIIYGEVYKGDKLFRSVHNFKLKLGNTLHHQALLIPKALHVQPPFNIKYKVYADFDFNQRLNKRKISFKYCKDFKAYALPSGISAFRKESEMLQIVKANYGMGMFLAAFIYYKGQKLKELLGK